jgi:hypothetical protein
MAAQMAVNVLTQVVDHQRAAVAAAAAAAAAAVVAAAAAVKVMNQSDCSSASSRSHNL